MNPDKPQNPQSKEPHPARLQAFVLFCQGYRHGLIADLLCVNQSVLSGWKKRDEWPRWQAELHNTTTLVPVPTWAAYLLQQQHTLRQQLADLTARLATPPAPGTYPARQGPPHSMADVRQQLEALKASLDEPPTPA